MRSMLLRLAILCGLALSSVAARADLLIYPLGGGSIVLQGKVTYNPGGTLNFDHPAFAENLYFKIGEVEIKKAATTTEQFGKLYGRAKTADAAFDAAVWALKHGLLKECYKAVDKALELDPKHERALNVKSVKALMEAPLEDTGKEENEMKELLKNRPMSIEKSAHYILMHDTPNKPPEGQKKTRAKQRIELLERVYESFLLTFYARGVTLDIPKERLKVVLFREEADFREYSVALDPSLASAAGFWSPDNNTAIFYDAGTTEGFKALQELADTLDDAAKEAIRLKAPNKADIRRLANTIDMLVQVERENMDITVVSHECTHQMAGNTGLFPRQVMIPSWIHEGLATYFEAPGDATWAGIGAVNDRRIEWYRALADDREHSHMNFIVGDQIFDYAQSLGAILHGYAQAWAITHFLLERHFDKFMLYYRMLGEMPRDVRLSEEILISLFKRVFGDDTEAFTQQWHSYMRGLKTDVELIMDAD